MSRPSVTVVMPFAGTPAQAAAALQALRSLAVRPGDELILADNSSSAAPSGVADPLVIPAAGERSPAHARNVGAQSARGDWILFLDADCTAPPDLLDRFFDVPVADEVGALAGAILPEPATSAGVAARYAVSRSFLSLDAHLAHPYLPRAAAASLLVRRAAFESIGGFCENVRAAEDTDLCWRLQRAGWRLEGRPGAAVEHRYRATLGDLRRQWRGYAAGRAWLSRRYPDFAPQPALGRAAARALRSGAASGSAPRRSVPRAPVTRRDRVLFGALDALLGIEELVGFILSNRPAGADRSPPASVVAVAAAGEPLPAPEAPTVRVEAVARSRGGGAGRVSYLEDDGAGERALALVRLLLSHPLRCLLDRVTRGGDEPGLAALAPAVSRARNDQPGARIRPLPGAEAQALARRLARLSGLALER
ncbi:MAG: glycosyltransferase family 2 protein [Solirubrobacteraceae bacterium]